MHNINSHSNFEHLGLDELEAIRAQAGVSRAELVRRASINPTTYTRWMRFLRGEPGGGRPHARTLGVVRCALRSLIAERRQRLEQIDRLAS